MFTLLFFACTFFQKLIVLHIQIPNRLLYFLEKVLFLLILTIIIINIITFIILILIIFLSLHVLLNLPYRLLYIVSKLLYIFFKSPLVPRGPKLPLFLSTRVTSILTYKKLQNRRHRRQFGRRFVVSDLFRILLLLRLLILLLGNVLILLNFSQNFRLGRSQQ